MGRALSGWGVAGDLLEELQVSLGDAGPVELPGGLTTVVSHSAGCVIMAQVGHGFGELVDGAWCAEQACFVGFDDVGNPAGIAAEDGFAAGQGFQQHQWQVVFLGGREDREQAIL